MIEMKANKDNYIIEDNLTYAWGKAISLLLKSSVKEVHPLIVTVKNIANNIPKEDETIRESIDQVLYKRDKYSCHTVANTIFPISLWNPAQPRSLLYTRFKNIYPQIKKSDTKNRYGIYFNRFINYSDKHHDNEINQLEYIINTRKVKRNRRRSAYQASVINPYTDHTNQLRRGFPCLQQVSFSPIGSSGLSVTGFYPKQYIFDRAYGNYLGLCRLGRFIAHELELELAEMTCIAGIATLGSINKTDTDLKNLCELIKSRKD